MPPVDRRTLLRFAAAATGMIAVGGTMAACTSPAATLTGGVVRLDYWSWWGGFSNVVDIWNARNPGVQVTATTIPGGTSGGYQKVFSALNAGAAPDLAQLENYQIPAFLIEDGLVDLAPHGGTAIVDKLVPWQADAVQFAGGIYGVPVDGGPLVTYYRRDRYEELGLTVPTTWAEYAETARAVRVADPKSYIEAFPLNDPEILLSLMSQAGGKWVSVEDDTWVVDIASEASTEVARFWGGLVGEDLLDTRRPPWATSWYSGLQDGTVLGWTAASWAGPIIQGNDPDKADAWAVAPMPQWPAVNGSPARTTTQGGSSSVVLRGSQHPVESLAFATWLATDPEAIDAMTTFCGIGWSSAQGHYDTQLAERSAYFSNEHVVAEYAASSALVPNDWTWWPTVLTSRNHFADALAAGPKTGDGFVAALREVQLRTVADLRNKGLNVRSAA